MRSAICKRLGRKPNSTGSTPIASPKRACSWRLAEFVGTYGEEAAATFTEKLPARIKNGEFSLEKPRQ